MTAFTHVHQSGYWAATAAEWAIAAKNACRVASVVTFTETTSHNPSYPGYKGYHGVERPGANEGSILWDPTEWDQAGPGFAIPVSKTEFALGNGKPRPRIHMIGVPLRHKATGRVVIFSVVHTPSAVEGKNGLVAGARRAIAYRETLQGIARVRKELRKRYPGAGFVMAGDWNLNMRLPWSRALLRSLMPGLASSWRALPSRGTHGSGLRVIDDARHSRRLKVPRSSTLLVRPKGFDHTPVRTVFAFRGK